MGVYMLIKSIEFKNEVTNVEYEYIGVDVLENIDVVRLNAENGEIVLRNVFYQVDFSYYNKTFVVLLQDDCEFDTKDLKQQLSFQTSICFVPHYNMVFRFNDILFYKVSTGVYIGIKDYDYKSSKDDILADCFYYFVRHLVHDSVLLNLLSTDDVFNNTEAKILFKSAKTLHELFPNDELYNLVVAYLG